MSKVLFATGVTGYIGGTVVTATLRRLKEANVQVTARVLVRDEEKGRQIVQWGEARGFDIVPVIGSLSSKDVVVREIASADYFVDTADCDDLQFAHYAIEGLTQAISAGRHPIVIHTSGTNLLTDGAKGLRTSEKIYHDDNDQETASIAETQPHRNVDLALLNYLDQNRGKLDLAIIAPPTIWGLGRGPVAVHSQQIPRMIRVALKYKQAYNVGKGLNIWTQINVVDLAELYALLLTRIIAEPDAHSGFYWCEGGEFAWKEVSSAIQRGLFDAGFITADKVNVVHDTAEQDGSYEKTFPDSVNYDYWSIIGGNSRVRAVKGRALGWEPYYSSRQEFISWISNEVFIFANDPTIKPTDV